MLAWSTGKLNKLIYFITELCLFYPIFFYLYLFPNLIIGNLPVNHCYLLDLCSVCYFWVNFSLRWFVSSCQCRIISLIILFSCFIGWVSLVFVWGCSWGISVAFIFGFFSSCTPGSRLQPSILKSWWLWWKLT